MPEIRLDDHGGLLAALLLRLIDEPFWRKRVRACLEEGAEHAMHLAVFREPYLELLLQGRKTIESRFSVNRIAPYESAVRDDLVLVKRAAGPVVGLFLLDQPGFYELDEAAWEEIPRFAAEICVSGPAFWAERRHTRYASLLPVRAAISIEALPIRKRDRRGWVRLPAAGTTPLTAAPAAAR